MKINKQGYLLPFYLFTFVCWQNTDTTDLLPTLKPRNNRATVVLPAPSIRQALLPSSLRATCEAIQNTPERVIKAQKVKQLAQGHPASKQLSWTLTQAMCFQNPSALTSSHRQWSWLRQTLCPSHCSRSLQGEALQEFERHLALGWCKRQASVTHEPLCAPDKS